MPLARINISDEKSRNWACKTMRAVRGVPGQDQLVNTWQCLPEDEIGINISFTQYFNFQTDSTR